MPISDREKKFVIFGGSGLALFILLFFILPAFMDGCDSSGSGSLGKQKSDLDTIMSLSKDFATVRSEFRKTEVKINNNRSFSLLTELENIANNSEVKTNIESMDSKTKPKNDFFKEEAVEIRLVKITLKQLTTLLFNIEHSQKVLRVKKLHIQVRYDNKDLLDAQLQVSTFKPLS